MNEEDGHPSATSTAPSTLIEGRSAADIIAEHEANKAAAATDAKA